ncbi:MAG: DUF4249 family protein [Bacteroidota bacterium]
MKRILLFLSVLVTGCSIADLPVEVEPAASELVVSSIRVGDVAMLVTVSRSFSALSATSVDSLEADLINTLLVADALVTVSHPMGTDTLFQVPDTPGVYTLIAPDNLQPYDLLTLSVVDFSSGQSIEAVTEWLPVATLDTVSLTEESDGDSTAFSLSYAFEDLPGDNYYALYGYKIAEGDSVDIEDPENPLASLNTNELIFYRALLTDQAVDGAMLSGSELIFDDALASADVFLTLAHISEGYFRFLDARQRTGGLISSLVNEPVNHPTNVRDGLGYFSAHLPTIFEVE